MQDTIYSRAKRGDLPPVLSIADLCRLSTASLDCPLGAYSPGDDLAVRLRKLVTLGLVTPERSEEVSTPSMILGSFGGSPITTSGSTHMEHYISAASLRAMLSDLGEVGPMLAAWIDSGLEAAPTTKATTTKATTPKRERWYVERVTRFCEAIITSGEIDPDAPGFTAEALRDAMSEFGLWRRTREHPPAPNTLRGYAAKVGGKFFVFEGGRPKGKDTEQRHKLEVGRLVALYRLAVPENSEPGNRAPTVSASNFHRVAGG